MSASVERHPEWTARQWFAAAVRSFLEEHQGCPCCRQRHCVFCSQWGTRVEYYCPVCDFSAAHDSSTGSFAATPGGPRSTKEGGSGMFRVLNRTG